MESLNAPNEIEPVSGVDIDDEYKQEKACEAYDIMLN